MGNSSEAVGCWVCCGALRCTSHCPAETLWECRDEDLMELWFMDTSLLSPLVLCYLVWSSLWLVPVARGRWLPSSCTHCFAAVEPLQQINSQQNPLLIALHQGWTWSFILDSSKGKRSEKNTSIFLTVLMFGCANIFHLIEGVLVPHPEALSAGEFKYTHSLGEQVWFLGGEEWKILKYKIMT